MKINFDEIQSDEYLDRLFERAHSGIRIHGGNVYDLMRPSCVTNNTISDVSTNIANDTTHQTLVTPVEATAVAVLSDMVNISSYNADVEMQNKDQTTTTVHNTIIAPLAHMTTPEFKQRTPNGFKPLTNTQVNMMEKLYLNKRNTMEAIEFQSHGSKRRHPITVKSGYGEPTIKTMEKVLQYMTEQCPLELRLDHTSSFVDIGSGLGKCVVLAKNVTNAKKCIGIEVMPIRHKLSCDALKEFEVLVHDNYINVDVEFIHGDASEPNIISRDSTHLYFFSWLFKSSMDHEQEANSLRPILDAVDQCDFKLFACCQSEDVFRRMNYTRFELVQKSIEGEFTMSMSGQSPTIYYYRKGVLCPKPQRSLRLCALAVTTRVTTRKKMSDDDDDEYISSAQPYQKKRRVTREVEETTSEDDDGSNSDTDMEHTDEERPKNKNAEDVLLSLRARHKELQSVIVIDGDGIYDKRDNRQSKQYLKKVDAIIDNASEQQLREIIRTIFTNGKITLYCR